MLLITQVPLALGMVYYLLNNQDAGVSLETAKTVFAQSFTVGDVLGYVAGILGSSTAYAIMKIQAFSVRPFLTLLLISAPFVVLLFASPMYIQDVDGGVQNGDFGRTYATVIIGISIALWIHALYQSRAFFDIQLRDNGAANIIRDIQGDQQ
ncbi:MAG: hypothetical protein H6898_16810 [Rhodobacter sp.]|nr:hypothetical protein [Paracoccaceae bacterium]MCC0078217.1 hypothetical protein [Rhodobacter sp.]